jgi:hypothetical protein
VKKEKIFSNYGDMELKNVNLNGYNVAARNLKNINSSFF